MSGTLTVSGNEITDLTRANALAWLSTQQGGSVDQYQADGSFGIFEAGTNLFSNGQCDALGTSWVNNGSCPIALDATTPAPFSPQSVKCTPAGSGAVRSQTALGLAVPAGAYGVASIWVKRPVGQTIRFNLRWYNTDSSTSEQGTQTTAATGQWQLLVPPPFPVAAGKTGDRLALLVSGNAGGGTFWVAHPMLQGGVNVVTPYVATSGGATATRAAARVQAPASLLSAAQGWVAARIRTGFASTSPPLSNADVFDWRTDNNNRLHLRFNIANSEWEAVATVVGVETVAQIPAAFNAGDLRTVVMAWGSFGVAVSVNGSPFTVAAAVLPVPANALFDIGSAAGTSFLNGDVLWFASGTGTVTSAAALNAFGNTDMCPEDVNAVCPSAATTATMPLDTTYYFNEAFTIIDPTAAGASRGILPRLKVELDVTNAPTNPTRVWTTITGDIRSLTYSRAGRQDELQLTQPGSLQTVVGSPNAKYDPTNPAGIGIRRSQWLRVRARWGTGSNSDWERWRGVISNISQSWPQAGNVTSAVTITANDAMKVLTLYDLRGQTFPSQTTDARLSAICTLIGLVATVDDSGQSTLIAVTTPLPKQSYADQHLQQVEQTENGLIFAGPDGTIHFQSRHYRTLYAQTPKATIGDTAGAILYRDSVTVETADDYLVNYVTVTPTNSDGSVGTDEIAEDATSQQNNFQRSNSQIDRTILVSSGSEALACAQWLLARYKDPSPRIPTVQAIGSQLGRRAPGLWPTLLGANNSDRFTFVRSADGNAIEQDCFVEKITETIVPATSWDIDLQLSPADASLFWLAGIAGFGEADVHTFSSY